MRFKIYMSLLMAGIFLGYLPFEKAIVVRKVSGVVKDKLILPASGNAPEIYAIKIETYDGGREPLQLTKEQYDKIYVGKTITKTYEFNRFNSTSSESYKL